MKAKSSFSGGIVQLWLDLGGINEDKVIKDLRFHTTVRTSKSFRYVRSVARISLAMK